MNNVKKSTKAITGLLLSLAVVALVVQCGKKDASTAAASMVIVNTTGNVQIERNKQELTAKIGMVVQVSDIIKTADGIVDLQNKNGSAVRIREYTSIQINKLLGGGNSDTRLTMNHGSILAKVEKKSKNETFKIVTPTAIAGVRGTTFTVEAEDGEPTRVKVLDGAVVMAPRIQALENVTEEDLAGNEELKARYIELKKLAKNSEKLIEAEHEGKLDVGVEKAVANLNEKSGAEESKIAKIEVLKESVNEVKKSVSIAESIQVKKIEITQEDLTEKETLITAGEDIIERLQAGDAKAVDALTKERDIKQEAVLAKIEERASKTELNSAAEIKKHYNKLESLQLKDGTTVTGAVIAQTGSVLVVHTKDGVKRINTSSVAAITYP